MARTPRTFSGRGHAEAKAGENIGQGKPCQDLTKRRSSKSAEAGFSDSLTDSRFGPLCGSAYFVGPLA